ncbi:unnamed protein product [Lampetra fluviatilis]
MNRVAAPLASRSGEGRLHSGGGTRPETATGGDGGAAPVEDEAHNGLIGSRGAAGGDDDGGDDDGGGDGRGDGGDLAENEARRQRVETKCAELAEMMWEEGCGREDIELKVSAFRRLLLNKELEASQRRRAEDAVRALSSGGEGEGREGEGEEGDGEERQSSGRGAAVATETRAPPCNGAQGERSDPSGRRRHRKGARRRRSIGKKKRKRSSKKRDKRHREKRREDAAGSLDQPRSESHDQLESGAATAVVATAPTSSVAPAPPGRAHNGRLATPRGSRPEPLRVVGNQRGLTLGGGAEGAAVASGAAHPTGGPSGAPSGGHNGALSGAPSRDPNGGLIGDLSEPPDLVAPALSRAPDPAPGHASAPPPDQAPALAPAHIPRRGI